jgi:hypothetical protein
MLAIERLSLDLERRPADHGRARWGSNWVIQLDLSRFTLALGTVVAGAI